MTKYICKKDYQKVTTVKDEKIVNNIYTLTHFKFMKREYEETTFELERFNTMWDKQAFKLVDNEKMLAYQLSLEVRQANIKAQIRIRAERDLDRKFEADFDFEQLFGLMNDNLIKGQDQGREMDGDLLTYNILKNDKYLYLQKLKNVLDYLKAKHAKK